MCIRDSYSTELKVKTIRRYEKGESIKALSQELHISQSTLYQWRKEYCSIKTPNHTYTPAEFDAISRHLQKLEHHMEIIRQTEYLSNIICSHSPENCLTMEPIFSDVK